MSVQVIEGTVDSIDPGRDRGKISVYKSARFTTVDGQVKTLPRFVAPVGIKGDLTPGSRARFYHFKNIDHQGLFGVRAPDGRAVFDYPRNNEWIAVGVVAINLLWITLMVLTEGRIPMLAVALIILGAVLWFFSRKTYNEAKALFDQG